MSESTKLGEPKKPNYFVVVFGDPSNGDPVESGRYQSGEGYPDFKAEAGDMLLLYCTNTYTGYETQAPGIGVAFETATKELKYRWIKFVTPIPLDQINQKFDADDSQKMRELYQKWRRVFPISAQSFQNVVAGQSLTVPMALGQTA